MDYQKIAEEKRKEAQALLQKLDVAELDKKIQRRAALLKELKDLDQELANLLGVEHVGSPAGRVARTRGGRRRSLTDSEKEERIRALLTVNPEGLSAKRLAIEMDDTYLTVQAYLKKHPQLYIRSGEKKSTVYKLAR
jgi:hypothetical protein